MPDGTEDMRLSTFGINSIAHRLPVDGQSLVSLGVLRIPVLQGAVERAGVDANEHLAKLGPTRDQITAIAVATAKARAACWLPFPST